MANSAAAALHWLAPQELTPAAFSPFGEVIQPDRRLGQFAEAAKARAINPNDAKLVLNNGEPRLSILYLPNVGLAFSKMARHRRVTQCLGSLMGKEWLIAVAPPGDLADTAHPRVADVTAFRIPGTCVVKLHVATWHAGPHFVHDECMFFNLENRDTNAHDFHLMDLGVECRFRV